MRDVNVKFLCIDTADQPINYELYSSGDVFKVIRDGWNPTKAAMDLVKSIEFLLNDIRNLRLILYFNSNQNVDSSLRTSLEHQLKAHENDIYLPEIYKPYLQELVQAIISGNNEFIVLFEIESSFIKGDKIYFDKVFLEEIQKLDIK